MYAARAAAFDREFPPKEAAAGTASQKRFWEVAAMRRPAPDTEKDE